MQNNYTNIALAVELKEEDVEFPMSHIVSKEIDCPATAVLAVHIIYTCN
jgi:hypothetical protein